MDGTTFRYRLFNQRNQDIGYIVAYYNIEDISKKTQIIGSKFNISQIESLYIDDVNSEITTSYQFDVIGEHVIKIYFSPATKWWDYLFYDVSSLRVIDVSNFDASEILSAYRMCSGATQLTNIIGLENLSFSKLKNLSYAFYECANLEYINAICFEKSPLRDCSYLFDTCSSISIDNLHLMNLSSVTTARSMFSGSSVSVINQFVHPPNNCANCSYMFSHSNVISVDLQNWNNDYWVMTGMFKDCELLETVLLPGNVKASAVDYLFQNCTSLTNVPEFILNLDLERIEIDKVLNAYSMFKGCVNITNVNLSGWKNTNEKYIFADLMFYECSNVETIVLPTCTFTSFSGTSGGFDYGLVFANCVKLKTVDLSNTILSTSLLYKCFYNCKSLENVTFKSVIEVSGHSINPIEIFAYCGPIDLDLKSWDVSTLTSLKEMFQYCGAKSLDLSNWDTSNVTDMSCTFYNCINLESINTVGWDTSNVTDMNRIFGRSSGYNNLKLTILDLSHWNFENVLNLTSAFALFQNCTEIYVNSRFNKNLEVRKDNYLIHPSTSGGTFYYNSLLSNCSPIIAKLPDNWTAISTFTVTECTSLSITGEDVYGNETVAPIHYTAIVNGVYNDGTRVENQIISETGWSESFDKNTSETESIIRTIVFTIYETTATTVITQKPYIDYHIICKYSIPSTTTKYSLFSYSYGIGLFDYMIVDGVQQPVLDNYLTFTTTGEHEVIFHISDETKLQFFDGFFYGNKQLLECDMSHTNLRDLYYCSGISSMFYNCTSLQKVILPETIKTLGYQAFCYCKALVNLTIMSSVAPIILKYAFRNANSDSYMGIINRNKGTNKLYIPVNAEGYDSDVWMNSKIFDKNYCGFTRETIYEPTECTHLSINANNVTGGQTYTTIYWEAVTNGFDGVLNRNIENVMLTGTAISDSFEQNTSETETITREISFTYLGVTATTTIIQGVKCTYDVILNDQWQISTEVTNPDSSFYEGVYESFSNYNVNSGYAKMYIDITNYETFKFYIRSYAESNYDYVMVSQLDQDIIGSTSYSDTTLVKAHTRGSQSSGTAINNYKLVEFTGIDGGYHRITIVYRKDGSGNSGTDKGYILIPKNQ